MTTTPHWSVGLVSALGGLLGGATVGAGAAALPCYGMITGVVRDGPRTDSVTNGTIPVVASVVFAIVAVLGCALVGGIAGGVLTYLRSRRVGRVPVFAYVGYGLAAAAVIGYLVMHYPYG